LELGVGEALVSLLDEKGAPAITQRAWMLAPGSQIGPITPQERRALIANSVVAGVYEKEVDRESAMEMLKARAETAAANAGAARAGAAGAGSANPGAATTSGGMGGAVGGMIFGSTGPRGGHHDGLIDLMAKSAARSAGSAISRTVLRGVLGSLMGGRRR
ncbi:MAG: helicase HerA-like domain-containing protein, partial [Gemmatimonadaceae bacterium]